MPCKSGIYSALKGVIKPNYACESNAEGAVTGSCASEQPFTSQCVLTSSGMALRYGGHAAGLKGEQERSYPLGKEIKVGFCQWHKGT